MKANPSLQRVEQRVAGQVARAAAYPRALVFACLGVGAAA